MPPSSRLGGRVRHEGDAFALFFARGRGAKACAAKNKRKQKTKTKNSASPLRRPTGRDGCLMHKGTARRHPRHVWAAVRSTWGARHCFFPVFFVAFFLRRCTRSNGPSVLYTQPTSSHVKSKRLIAQDVGDLTVRLPMSLRARALPRREKLLQRRRRRQRASGGRRRDSKSGVGVGVGSRRRRRRESFSGILTSTSPRSSHSPPNHNDRISYLIQPSAPTSSSTRM
jgi:hypothetical protein